MCGGSGADEEPAAKGNQIMAKIKSRFAKVKLSEEKWLDVFDHDPDIPTAKSLLALALILQRLSDDGNRRIAGSVADGVAGVLREIAYELLSCAPVEDTKAKVKA